jgi:oligopeptide transport system substrate-binding protein
VKAWLTRTAILALAVAGVLWFGHVQSKRPSRARLAAEKNILLIGNGTEVETLDAHLATGVPEHWVISSLFEGLAAPLAENPDGDGPGAAASWEHSPDYTAWTFHLQPAGKWSDGRPLTAHDFVWSFHRILMPKIAAEYASMLYPLKNAQAFNEGKITDFNQVGAVAADDLTLKLTLEGPTPYLPGMTKHYSWFPLPRHVIERFGDLTERDTKWTRAGNLVGNGPFRLKEWHFFHSISVDRNPYYWDAKSVKLNGIVFFPIQSDNTEERAFRDGQLHATSTLPLPAIPKYRRERAEAYHEDPNLAVYFYRVNVTSRQPDGKPHPVCDKRVRHALSLAIDRESIIRNVMRAGQKPAVGFTPYPDSIGFHDAPHPLRFDPVEARRVLAEAGYPDGRNFPSFEILINTNEGHRTIAEAIQEMWKRHLNIPVSIRNQDWGVYLDSQRRLDYTVCRAAWNADYLDPSTFLSMWRTGDGNNETGWSNARYDELLKLSTLEGDPQKRMGLFREAETILLDDLPVLPVYWYVRSTLRSPAIRGWNPSVIEMRCYKAIWLDPAASPQS